MSEIPGSQQGNISHPTAVDGFRASRHLSLNGYKQESGEPVMEWPGT